MLTCKDAIDLLLDYLEQSLTDDLVAEFERHLQDCPPCVAYLNTYRTTRKLTGEVMQVSMPEEMKARLRRFLFEQFARETS